MNKILDKAWEHIETALYQAVLLLDNIISNIEFLGAPILIFLLTFAVVLMTRFISKHYVTRRYKDLKKEFEHWHSVREEALKHPDREKGKALAKNIDQAELNKAYYDYFFEGMLKNFVSNVLPVLLTAAYLTKIYTPENLVQRFGQNSVFVFSLSNTQIEVSTLFWYVISLIVSFILYWGVKAITHKKNNNRLAADTI